MTTKNIKKVVVIGGGTGTSVVLSGLKKHNLDLSAIVSVADSGGSTGRLRDEFGFQPVGDLRQSLAALAKENDQAWIRKLLLYRFSRGEGLKGHNLGNLILTALQDMTGSTPKSLDITENIFQLEGKIIPVTNKIVELVIEYDDGTIIIGEHHLNPENVGGKKIKSIKLSPKASINSKAKQAILDADAIVIGPGDLFASLLPNLVVDGVKKAIKDSKAKVIYVLNLMSRYTQTHNYKASDYLHQIEKHLGKTPDYTIINNGKIPSNIIKNYQKEKEHIVRNDLKNTTSKIIKKDLVKIAKTSQKKSDTIKRSLLRHNEDILTKIILGIIK